MLNSIKKYLFLLILLSNSVLATPIKEIVFFGDSLSDNGNLYRETKQLLPHSPPYYEGRFSNGPVWSEMIADYFYHYYHINSFNYAVAGAMAVPHRVTSHLHHFLLSEINQYLREHPDTDKSQTLFVIWIGGNDYIDTKFSETDSVAINDKINIETKNTINGIKFVLNTLITEGAQYFMLFNLPDFSKTPFGLEESFYDRENLHKLALNHNEKLSALITLFKKNHPEVHFIFHDIYTDLEGLFNDLATFNLKYHKSITHISEACYPTHDYGYLKINDFQNISDPMAPTDIQEAALFGSTPCAPEVQDQYAFWDRLHPTAVMHQIIAQIAGDALLKENVL